MSRVRFEFHGESPMKSNHRPRSYVREMRPRALGNGHFTATYRPSLPRVEHVAIPLFVHFPPTLCKLTKLFDQILLSRDRQINRLSRSHFFFLFSSIFPPSCPFNSDSKKKEDLYFLMTKRKLHLGNGII